MKILEQVSIDVVQTHEERTEANARLGGYGMDKRCPLDEFRPFRVMLERDDIDRLFLLNDFVKMTQGDSCKLQDIFQEAITDTRVAPFVRSNIDLRSASNLEIVIVAADSATGPLVIIDGNHRAIAQYLRYGEVGEVPAFVCVHRNIIQWGLLPPAARRTRV